MVFTASLNKFCITEDFIPEFQQLEYELCTPLSLHSDSGQPFPLNLIDYFTEQKKQYNCFSQELLDKFESDCHYLYAVYLCVTSQVIENNTIRLPIDVQQFKLDFSTMLIDVLDSQRQRTALIHSSPLSEPEPYYLTPMSYILPDCIRKCFLLGAAGLITAGVATGIHKRKRR